MGKIGAVLFLFLFAHALTAQNFENALENARKSSSLFEKLSLVRTAVYQLKNFKELSELATFIFEEAQKEKPADFDIEEVQGKGLELIQISFETRIRINSFLKEYQKEINPSQLSAISNFLRLLRSVEDLIGEYNLQSERLTRKLAFQGDPPFNLWNPKFGGVDSEYIPQSGDVIVTRGTAATSAAIARMGDRDGQFTHQAIVYVDPSGKVFTLESHIEVGNDIFQWKNFIQKKARTVVFRHRNPEYGPKAANYLFELLREAKRNGKLIPYDFKLKFGNHKAFYCSELVHHGFESVGAPVLPTSFFNGLTMLGRKTLGQLGVEANSFIAPSDIEIDPNFELVVEWRDFAATQETRQKDAVMDAIYELIQNSQYFFAPTLKQRLFAMLLKVARGTPMTDEILKKYFPLNMPLRSLSLMMALNKVVGLVAGELKAFDLTYYQEAGLHAPNPVLVQEAKRILLDERHPTHKKIHRYFRQNACALALRA